ncbi:MAG: formyltetrahydrofolate deformylase [Deltaproteobacteria bacterium]|nr:formyltetrahydrofolate deformylase [Deltaproteobacteria bacterium]
MPTTATLLMTCQDQKGLVQKISDFIYRRNGNILHADQHIDFGTGQFFSRVEWDLEAFGLAREKIGPEFSRLADSLGMQWELRFSDERTRIAIFVSRLDHCLVDLLHRHAIGELHADVVAIIGNHQLLRPVAEQRGIPYHVFPITAGNKRAQEEKELQLLDSLKVDLIVLARYMQILTQAFVSRYPNRIINIHHSFLPAFAGARPYVQAHARGVKLIGATSHYVTPVVDEGPIIEQDVVRISHRDTVDDLGRKGRDLERVVLARAVRLHLERRVLPYGNKTVVFD